MVTLQRLNFEETSELHRRLSRRWRNSSNHALACRRYRLMCKAFIQGTVLMHRAERAALGVAA